MRYICNSLERSVEAFGLGYLVDRIAKAFFLEAADDGHVLVEILIDLDEQRFEPGIGDRYCRAANHLVFEAVDIDLDMLRLRHRAGLDQGVERGGEGALGEGKIIFLEAEIYRFTETVARAAIVEIR